MAGADVGVLHLPNREVWKHASPLKVAEYAAAGLPVVASEVSGLEQYRDEDWIQLIEKASTGDMTSFELFMSLWHSKIHPRIPKEWEKNS